MPNVEAVEPNVFAAAAAAAQTSQFVHQGRVCVCVFSMCGLC